MSTLRHVAELTETQLRRDHANTQTDAEIANPPPTEADKRRRALEMWAEEHGFVQSRDGWREL
jgi:hypothetical protein